MGAGAGGSSMTGSDGASTTGGATAIAGFAVFTRRGGGSTGAAGFGGSGAFFAGAGFLPF
jgi:hypothetical protein